MLYHGSLVEVVVPEKNIRNQIVTMEGLFIQLRTYL